MDKKWSIILIGLFVALGGLTAYIIFIDNPDGTKKPASQIVSEVI